MKVLVLTPFLPYPLDSGGNTRTFNLLRQLDAQGLQILMGVITQEPFDPVALEQLGRDLPRVRFIHLPYRATPVRKALYFAANELGLDRWLCNRATLQAIRALLRQEAVDLIQVDYSQAARYLPATEIPALLVYIEFRLRVLEREAQLRGQAGNGLVPRLRRWLVGREELSHLPRYQAAICMSADDAEWLLARRPTTQVAVMENGVDLDAYPFKALTAPPRGLYFIGWFMNQQNGIGLDFFLESVWPRLRDQEIPFVVAGKDLDAARRARLDQLGIPYLGFLALPDLLREVQNRILVVPLRSGSGTRLKILEAMAMGNPVVSTAIGIEGIRAQDGIHYLHAETGAEFQRAIARLMTEPGLAAALAAQARTLVETEYGWAALGNKQIGIYRHLLNLSSPAADSTRR